MGAWYIVSETVALWEQPRADECQGDTATEGARFGSSWPSAPNTWLMLVRLSAQHFSFVPSLLLSLQSGLICQM